MRRALVVLFCAAAATAGFSQGAALEIQGRDWRCLDHSAKVRIVQSLYAIQSFPVPVPVSAEDLERHPVSVEIMVLRLDGWFLKADQLPRYVWIVLLEAEGKLSDMTAEALCLRLDVTSVIWVEDDMF